MHHGSTLCVGRALLHCPLQQKSLLPTTVMSTLNACLKVANIAKASGVLYVENVAKVALFVSKLLEVHLVIVCGTNVVADSVFYSKGEGIRRVRRSSESNADTIVVIDTLVRMQGEQEILCYIEICREMESCEAFFIYCRCSTGTQRLFTGIVKAWRRNVKLKYRGSRGIFCVDDFRDAMQTYRRRVDDLKTDLVVIVPFLDFPCRISQSTVDPFSWRVLFRGLADAQPIEERDGSGDFRIPRTARSYSTISLSPFNRITTWPASANHSINLGYHLFGRSFQCKSHRYIRRNILPTPLQTISNGTPFCWQTWITFVL